MDSMYELAHNNLALTDGYSNELAYHACYIYSLLGGKLMCNNNKNNTVHTYLYKRERPNQINMQTTTALPSVLAGLQP